MTIIAVILVVIFVVGAGAGIYARLAPKRVDVERVAAVPSPPLEVTTRWTDEAGDEFTGLFESERCDLVFAVAALDDERSQHLLEHALNDPAEAVALAAAHALASNGRRTVVEAFLARYPGERAERLKQTLALLDT